jgi:hypothetical protein
MTISRLILFFAAAGIGLVGLVYLFAPTLILGANGMTIETVNEYHATRAAYGGQFVASGLLFLFGALWKAWRRPALIALATFMTGFAAGRIFSLIVDGMPAPGFLVLLATEIILAAAAFDAIRNDP